MSKINLNEIEVGDIFSEISHYVVLSKDTKNITVKHLKSNEKVELSTKYIQLLSSADQYSKEVIVGKEDKHWTAKQIADAVKKGEIKIDEVKVGDLRQKGIRRLFEEIHSQTVFTVCFQKADKKRSAKELNDLKEKQLTEAFEKVEKAYSGKRGVKNAALEILKEVQNNPISEVILGEDRVLRGYKVQFNSIDGKYDCVDMDIVTGDNRRPVNILTIKYLVVDDVKYVVE